MRIIDDDTIVVTVAGGGSADSTQHTVTREQPGPASYPTGGFVIDLAAAFTALNWLDLVVKKGARGALPATDYHVVLDSPAAGKATVKIMKRRYVRITTIGNVANQPAGVSILAASGGTSALPNTSHSHTADHDHASFATAALTESGTTSNLDALGPNMSTHTHPVDMPNIAVTTGGEAAHTHVDNSVYEHTHVETRDAAAAPTWEELANGTDLSATTWLVAACGQAA